MRKAILISVLLFTAAGTFSYAQTGTKERVKVYSKALEGNLLNDPCERNVTVYLPPSYNTKPRRHYPVVYMLHGFTDSDSKWFGWESHWINLHKVIDSALAEGNTKEMIVVMPDAYNRLKGSMYSSSVTTGDWETFVTKDLVEYIDTHYRTIPHKESRGLAGHSMGGYGTVRLGMKHPEVYSAIYLLSACCMEDGGAVSPAVMESCEALTTIDHLDSAPFNAMIAMASAAAWSPNPARPPLWLDLPFGNGVMRPEIAAKTTANRILYMVDQYIPNLRKLKAIAMDAGIQDQGISNSTRKLHELLDSYGIPHIYESYEGNHINRIEERIRTKTMPFFSENLSFR